MAIRKEQIVITNKACLTISVMKPEIYQAGLYLSTIQLQLRSQFLTNPIIERFGKSEFRHHNLILSLLESLRVEPWA